jgi:glutamate-5-semialdehyde dehydrogenase
MSLSTNLSDVSCDVLNPEVLLPRVRQASYQMATLSETQKNQALEALASLLEEKLEFLLEANAKDLEQANADQIAPVLAQRLKLDVSKVKQLAKGIRDVVNLPDPVGKTLSKTQLDEGLILEKRSVPLGVIGIIFESRPDVLPQILSLILKSGNAVVFKGGKEAKHSNRAFMALVDELQKRCPYLPSDWAAMLDSREAIRGILNYPQYVDLVIPRGSNALVQSVMESTKIPVLGHADGVCHLYVDASANPEKAIAVAIDAKIQYPAACNALETLLIDEAIAEPFLNRFVSQTEKAGIVLKGCEKTVSLISGVALATEEDWSTEYGDLTLSVKIVSNVDEAIAHINRYGSHHTDVIMANEPKVIEQFFNSVDSACVFSNASTRFADGFRFGLGAEIGISTAKTHARGPVGLEGLVIYKYCLQGSGQVVKDYVGENARPLQAKSLA